MTRLQQRTEAACGRTERPRTRNYCFDLKGVWIEAGSEAEAREAIADGLKLMDADANEIRLEEVE